ncbi:MAG: hypothetical protein P1U36_07925 [Legionellaceae bacterium]|nr:hypothetical protein [Legionellaceae bacterium]
MSRLPKNYQPIATPTNAASISSDELTKLLKTYQKSIQKRLKGNELALVPPSIGQSIDNTIQVLISSENKDDDFNVYLVELLARLNLHLAPKISDSEKEKNTKQLNRLLNQKVACIDRDVIYALLYSTGVAILASIGLFAIAGPVILTIPSNLGPLILPALKAILLTTSGLMSLYYDNQPWLLVIGLALSGYALFVSPGIFLATAGTCLAMFATFVGVFKGIFHGINEITFSTDNYKLRSDVSALINTGIFASNSSEQVPANMERADNGHSVLHESSTITSSA